MAKISRTGPTFAAAVLALALLPSCGGGSDAGSNGTQTGSVPVAPAGLSASAAAMGSIALSWTDSSTNESGFEVERGVAAAGPFALVHTTSAGVTSWTDTGLAATTAYFYRLRAVNGAGASSYTATASATTAAEPLAAPATLTATATSASTIALSWGSVTGATGYEMEWAASTAGPFSTLASTGTAATAHDDVGLAPSTTRAYRVRATGPGGPSGWSPTASATTQAPPAFPPAAPSRLSAVTGGAGTISLSWTDNADDEAGFEIERASAALGPFALVHSTAPNVTAWTDTGLTPSTTCFYRVRAVNGAGASSYTTTASATTAVPSLGTPAGLVAIATGTNTIAVSWGAVANATGFELESAAVASGPFSLLVTLAADARTYIQIGLVAGTTRVYRIRATGPGGPSGWSQTASATTLDPPTSPPAPPSHLVASTGLQSAIDLRWTDNSTDEGGFEIERGTSASGPFALVATVSAGVAKFADTGLLWLATYAYRVRAVNGAGASAWTTVASAWSGGPPPPSAPGNLAAIQDSSGSIRVTWSDVLDDRGYQLQTALDAGPWGAPVNLPPDTTNFVDNPATLQTAHYRIRAVNLGGASAWVETSIYVEAIAVLLPCFPPTGSTALATSETQIHLAWTKSSNCSSGYTVVERAPASAGPWSLVATVHDIPVLGGQWIIGNSLDDGGLQPSTPYWYRLKAASAGMGASVYTAPFAATTPTSLQPPTGLSGVATSSTTAHLSWTAPLETPDNYALEYADLAAGPYTEFLRLAATYTAAEITGLTPDVPTWFRVRSLRGTQTSDPSAPASVTPTASTSIRASGDAYVVQDNGFPDFQGANFGTDAADQVGCLYYWNADVLGVTGPYAHCSASLIQFDTSVLAGRSIRSATLRMTTCSANGVPPGTSSAAWAIFDSWNPATVNFNTTPNVHIQPSYAMYSSAPTGSGIQEWDVTDMAKQWASGAWASRGILVNHYLPGWPPPSPVPGSGSIEYTTYFCSLESAAGNPSLAPTLVVEFQ